MNWPAGVIDRLSVAKNVWRAFRAYSEVSGDLAKWADANPQTMEVVAEVMKMRGDFNNG